MTADPRRWFTQNCSQGWAPGTAFSLGCAHIHLGSRRHQNFNLKEMADTYILITVFSPSLRECNLPRLLSSETHLDGAWRICRSAASGSWGHAPESWVLAVVTLRRLHSLTATRALFIPMSPTNQREILLKRMLLRYSGLRLHSFLCVEIPIFLFVDR